MSQSTYNIVTSTDDMTVVSEYIPSKSTSESYQSEADLEKEFIALLTRQGYEYLKIHGVASDASLRFGSMENIKIYVNGRIVQDKIVKKATDNFIL